MPRRKLTDAELNAAFENPALLPPGPRRKKPPAPTAEDRVRRRAIAQARAAQTRAAKKKGGEGRG